MTTPQSLPGDVRSGKIALLPLGRPPEFAALKADILKLVEMEEGMAYLFNFGLEHRSFNRSQTTRLHLIWDLPLIPEVCRRLLTK